jgi:hypothetical protein
LFPSDACSLSRYGLYRRCVRRIPDFALSPLLERADAGDLAVPTNLTRLRSFVGETGLKGPGDIDIGDEDGEGWSCAPFPNQ